MTKKHLIGLILVLSFLMAFSCISMAEESTIKEGSIKVETDDETTFPDLAKITSEEATEIALKECAGDLLEVELEEENGYLVYEVEVVNENKEKVEILVDAGNGDILGVCTEEEACECGKPECPECNKTEECECGKPECPECMKTEECCKVFCPDCQAEFSVEICKVQCPTCQKYIDFPECCCKKEACPEETECQEKEECCKAFCPDCQAEFSVGICQVQCPTCQKYIDCPECMGKDKTECPDCQGQCPDCQDGKDTETEK